MWMRKFLLPALLLATGFVAPLPAQPQGAAAARVRLPRDTPVAIRTDYGVSSKAARLDDPVYMKVAKAVSYQGSIVIPEGAPVKGRVSDVTPPGGFGKSGNVVITAEYVTVGEDRIRLSGSTGDRGKPGGPSVTDGVLSVPLGKGRHVNIEAGTLFIAYTDQNY
jgi:hypothetical protein